MHVSKGQKIKSTGKEKIEAHTLKIRVCFSFMTLNGRFVISFLFFYFLFVLSFPENDPFLPTNDITFVRKLKSLFLFLLLAQSITLSALAHDTVSSCQTKDTEHS